MGHTVTKVLPHCESVAINQVLGLGLIHKSESNTSAAYNEQLVGLVVCLLEFPFLLCCYGFVDSVISQFCIFV